MKPSDDKLTAKQEAALVALLAHGTIDAAYEAAGVSKSTMWRFLQDAAFQSRYRGMRRQLVESAIGQLQAGCTKAVTVLCEVAEDKQASASARVAAARTIIEQSLRAVELEDVIERVERLEGLLEQKEGKRKWG
jgi:DNA-binding MurR/RpiR family transcriptional regulator